MIISFFFGKIPLGDFMESSLSLVLDEEGKISLTLFSGSSNEVDDYTIKNFNSSEDIRKKYEKQINEFLLKNDNYIQSVIKRTGRQFRGRIVILQAINKNDELSIIQRRVLYKKNLIVAREAIKNKKVMNVVACIDTNGFVNPEMYEDLNIKIKNGKFQLTPFIKGLIKQEKYDTQSNLKNVRSWLNNNSSTYYEKIRLLSSGYEHARTLYKSLKTSDALYKEYLESRVKPKTSKTTKKDIIESDEKNFVLVDGVRYPIDDIPYDLDELTDLGVSIFDGNAR